MTLFLTSIIVLLVLVAWICFGFVWGLGTALAGKSNTNTLKVMIYMGPALIVAFIASLIFPKMRK